jgi:hypothetical protein
MRKGRQAGARPGVTAKRGRGRAARVAVGLVVALGALSACRPLYIPLVPDAPEAPSALRLADDSELTIVDGRPRLELSLDAPGAAGVAEGVWLNVQWFGPSGRQAASGSVWIEARGDTPATAAATATAPAAALVFDLPDDVEVVPGEWRAVVSVDGVLLRQFRVDVAADPEE